MTTQSTRIFIALITYTIALFTYTSEVEKHICIYILITYIIVAILALIWSVILMFPKGVIYRGTQPEHILTNVFDVEEYTSEDKEKAVLFNIIRQYNDSIKKFDKINDKRHKKYKTLLILSLVLIITSVVMITL